MTTITRNTISASVAQGLRIAAPSPGAGGLKHVARLRISEPAVRLAQPSGKEPQANSDIDQSRGHPHDQATKLLVFKGAQAPGQGAAVIDGVPEPGRNREQRAQN